MKRTILSLIVLVFLGVGATHVEAISRIGGLQSDCSGCPVPPLTTVTVLCNQLANCPQTFAIDPSNSQNFYGVNAVGKRSTNGGTTWGNWIANPAAVPQSVGVTSAGTILSQSSASSCQIHRSIDGTASWTQTYASPGAATFSCGNSVTNATIKCIGITCVVFGYNSANRAVILQSVDDGQNWAIAYTSGAGPILNIALGVYWDGTTGIVQYNGSGANQSVDVIYTTSGVSGWIVTSNSQAKDKCYMPSNSPIFGIVTLCDFNSVSNINYVLVSGNASTLVTVPGLSPSSYGPVTIHYAGYQYIVNNNNISPFCSVWVAASGTVFTNLTCTLNVSTTSNSGEMIVSNGKIYGSNGGSGTQAIFYQLSSS